MFSVYVAVCSGLRVEMPVTEIVLFEFDRTPVPGVIELILNPAGAVAAVIRNELMFELPFGVSFLSGTVMFWVPAPTEVGNRRLNCFSGAALPGSASNANTTVAATRAISISASDSRASSPRCIASARDGRRWRDGRACVVGRQWFSSAIRRRSSG